MDQWQLPAEQLLRRQHVSGVEPFRKPVVNGLKYLGGTGSIFFLIESLGQQLKGEVQIAYEPNGFVYRLDVPLASLVAAA